MAVQFKITSRFPPSALMHTVWPWPHHPLNFRLTTHKSQRNKALSNPTKLNVIHSHSTLTSKKKSFSRLLYLRWPRRMAAFALCSARSHSPLALQCVCNERVLHISYITLTLGFHPIKLRYANEATIPPHLLM